LDVKYLQNGSKNCRTLHKCRAPVFTFSFGLFGGSGEEEINTFAVYLF